MKDIVNETIRLLKENINKKLEDKLMENYYYNVHISEDEVTGMGYSVFVKSDIHYDEDLEAEDIIDLAIEQGKLDPEEAEYCNYVEEVDEDQYRNATGENLTEDTTQDIDVYNQLKELEKECDYSDVSKYSDENIHVSFYTNDRQQIYGSIDTVNKTASLTTGSGPNPLNPEFLSLLNKLAAILKGYNMLHY